MFQSLFDSAAYKCFHRIITSNSNQSTSVLSLFPPQPEAIITYMYALLTLVWFSSIRGITLFSTNPKILRALQCKECTVPPCILMLNICLGGDVIIWSIGCTRNKWLTGRNRQSGLKCFNWVCTVDKPTWRKMKIFNAIFKNGLIKIKIKTLSAECFSCFIKTS